MTETKDDDAARSVYAHLSVDDLLAMSHALELDLKEGGGKISVGFGVHRLVLIAEELAHRWRRDSYREKGKRLISDLLRGH